MASILRGVISCAVAFSATSLLGSCRSSASSATVRTSDGIEVTSRPYAPDSHLARVLEARAWKFQVTTPKRPGNYACMLEVRKKGKPAVSLGGIGVGPGSEVVIIIEPGGSSFQHSSMLRIVRSLGEGRTHLRATYPNPFKGSTSTAVSKVGEPLDDGAFALISGGRDAISTQHRDKDTLLVCFFRDMSKRPARK